MSITTFCCRLNTSNGVNGTAIQWFRSYLTGQSQNVRRGSVKSSIVRLVRGAPEGSALEPVLFVLYTADLIHLTERRYLYLHIYAYDAEFYGSCSPVDVRQSQSRVSSCVDGIASWMQFSRLKLNTDKTEVLWCATSRRRHQLPTAPTRIGSYLITSSTSVRDLGVCLDADLRAVTRSKPSVKVPRRAETASQHSSTSLSLPNIDCVVGADET
jgi:hypothetical protein